MIKRIPDSFRDSDDEYESATKISIAKQEMPPKTEYNKRYHRKTMEDMILGKMSDSA
jgi:hypothetical protein